MMKIVHWALGILLVMPMGIAAGQAQSPSQDAQAPAPSDPLAAAAKAAREAKKDQAKPARVWNDDTIPKSNGAISVVGQTSADDADNAAAATGDAANAAATKSSAGGSAGAGGGTSAGAGIRGALETSIQNAKDKLATIKVDLDLLQRAYTLDSQMYYVKPDYASDTEGAAKLKDEQDQIAAKQQEMDEQQKKIDDLEAELAKLPEATTPPATPPANNSPN
jgi:hypothetical protein